MFSALPPVRVASLALFVSVVLLAIVPSAPRAQMAGPGELPPIDAGVRAAIVDSITAAIDSIYVLEEPAREIVSGLRKKLDDGDYDELDDPAEFAQRLFEDAQAIHHDGHFRIAALHPIDPELRASDRDEDPADAERRQRARRARNYSFQKVEILPGGVGYLRFDGFEHGAEAFEAASAAMNFLANANAVILDVRNNGGGSASMIRYLCGYLFDERTHLINWDVRAEDHTEQSYSLDHVPGRKIGNAPVYVLTSGRTFSAAEEFSFDLKNLERATLVGETTGGGGHTVSGYVFHFDGFRILARLPYGRAYFPPTNEGWEGVGVTPHIEAPAEDALEVAHAEALRRLIAEEEDEVVKGQLEWALLDVESREEPPALSREEKAELVGSYGPRRISIEDGDLFYQRDDGPRYRVEPMADNLFRVGDLSYFRLSFERDDEGRVTRIVGRYDDGRTDGHPRDSD